MRAKSLAVMFLFSLSLSMLLNTSPHDAMAQTTSKEKVLYFHNATETIQAQTQYTMNTSSPVGDTVTEVIFSSADRSFEWYQDPPLAGDLSLNGTVTLNIWMKLISGAGDGTLFVTLRVGLYEVFSNGTRAQIVNEGDAANQANLGPITSHFSEYFVKGQTSASYRATTGSRLVAVLQVSSNERAIKHVAWGSDDFRSRVSLPTLNHIAVARIQAFNGTGGEPSFFQANDTITFRATIVDPFGGYDIKWVNLTLQAPDESFLFVKAAMVQTSGNDTSLASTFDLVWDTVPKMRGAYFVTVEAVDNTGYHFRFPDRPGDETFGGHLESLTVTLSVGRVLVVNFLVLDSTRQPLAEASLELWDGTNLVASVTSNGTGYVKVSNVPGEGNYTVRVWWQAVKAVDVTVNISGDVPEDSPITLEVAVYYPTFRIVDNASVPLGDASVFLTHPNGTAQIFPFKTDLQGEFSLSKTPGGSYGLRITWSGVEVGVRSIVVSSNGVHIVGADVYYLTVEARAPDGSAVESVHVVATDVTRALVADSKLTGVSGTVTSRLPISIYNVEAVWFGANVGTRSGVFLAQNQTIVMSLQIFDIQVKIVDERSLPLEAATVEISFEGFRDVRSSDKNGDAAFKVPGGMVSLKVWWKDSLVFDASRTVDQTTTTITINAAVHYFTVRTVDRNGGSISGVTLVLVKDGVTVDAGITDLSGLYEFREPAGQYTVIAQLRTTYFLSDVDQTASESFQAPTDIVEVRFTEFALPLLSTNLFLVLLGIIAVAGAVLLIVAASKKGWLPLKSKSGSSKVPSTETPSKTVE